MRRPRLLLVSWLVLVVAGCGPEARPEVDGLRVSIPTLNRGPESSQATCRLEWTGERRWFLFRSYVPVLVRYWSFLGVPCGEEGKMVPLTNDFYRGTSACQEVPLRLEVPFWARSMTFELGRTDLVVERDLDE